MTEQQPLAALRESEPAIEPKAQKPANKTTSQGAQKPTKKPAAKASAMTDGEKRLARNAALREWRKKNKDRVHAYMTEWRAKRSGTKPPEAPATVTPKTPAPKPMSKAMKPSKKNTKKSKRGGKA